MLRGFTFTCEFFLKCCTRVSIFANTKIICKKRLEITFFKMDEEKLFKKSNVKFTDIFRAQEG